MLGLPDDRVTVALTSGCEVAVQPVSKRPGEVPGDSAGTKRWAAEARVVAGRPACRPPGVAGRATAHGAGGRVKRRPARAGHARDRAASLKRSASAWELAGWPRQRPVRGRVQGPGRGAPRARPLLSWCLGGRRPDSVPRLSNGGRRLCSGCGTGVLLGCLRDVAGACGRWWALAGHHRYVNDWANTVLVSALTSGLVALGIEWLAKPRLEAREERLLRLHCARQAFEARLRSGAAAAAARTGPPRCRSAP